MFCFVKNKIMKHTQEQMEQAIASWQQSGLNKKAFCKQENIAYATFHYWCKRLSAPSASGFSEIRVDGPPYSAHEIIFPSGARMIIHGEPATNWLRELVR